MVVCPFYEHIGGVRFGILYAHIVAHASTTICPKMSELQNDKSEKGQKSDTSGKTDMSDLSFCHSDILDISAYFTKYVKSQKDISGQNFVAYVGNVRIV